MATKKAPKDDERKARIRYIDQPGQRVDTTPKSIKKKQEKAWKDLENMMKKKPTKKK